MTKNNQILNRFWWLASLFILGSSIINLPTKNANNLTFLGFVLAFFASILVCFLVYNFTILKYPTLLLAVYFVGNTAITFLNFTTKTLLKNNQNFWVLALFLIPLFYTISRKTTQILSFSLICGLVCTVLLIFFFFATFKDFNFKNIYIYSLPNPKNLILNTLPYLTSVTLPTAVLTLYAKQQKVNKTNLFIGVGLGNFLLLVCVFNSILLFGTTLSGELLYPYSAAISTVTFGNLFTRLDGFAYFIYFVSTIIKITVCVKVIKSEIKNQGS